MPGLQQKLYPVAGAQDLRHPLCGDAALADATGWFLIPQEYRVIGPPGAGKTTWVKTQVEKWVGETYEPEDFLLTSFTRAAAVELAGRIDVPRRSVGTLHSVCYHGLERPPIAEAGALMKEWNSQQIPPAWRIGTPAASLEDGLMDQEVGSMMGRYSVARAACLPAEHPSWELTRPFAEQWDAFKKDTESVDFTDLLTRGCDELPAAPGDPKVLMIDEAQDLTPLQWRLVRQWAVGVERFIVVGDPAQCLYAFTGATPSELLHPLKDGRERLLGTNLTYRMPRAVHQYAERWLRSHSAPMCEGRTYAPRDAEGRVRHIGATWKAGEGLPGPWEVLDEVTRNAAEGRTSMVLASCAFMLKPLLMELRASGVPFHNPYRLTNGLWNPLGQARRGATSILDRVLAFVRPSPIYSGNTARNWTWGDISRWASILQAKGPDSVFAAHGVRARLTANAGDASRSRQTVRLTEDLEPLFKPEAMDALRELDLNWYRRSVLAKYGSGIEFIIRVLQRNGPEALREKPRIIVGTGHSVKGGEADHVYIFPDLSTNAWRDQLEGGTDGLDAMIRLGYVMMTRAREELVLAQATIPHLTMYL